MRTSSTVLGCLPIRPQSTDQNPGRLPAFAHQPRQSWLQPLRRSPRSNPATLSAIAHQPGLLPPNPPQVSSVNLAGGPPVANPWECYYPLGRCLRHRFYEGDTSPLKGTRTYTRGCYTATCFFRPVRSAPVLKRKAVRHARFARRTCCAHAHQVRKNLRP